MIDSQRTVDAPLSVTCATIPRTVAAQSYEAMMAGRRRVIGNGASTRVQYLSSMVTLDRAKAALHAVMARPRRLAGGGISGL